MKQYCQKILNVLKIGINITSLIFTGYICGVFLKFLIYENFIADVRYDKGGKMADLPRVADVGMLFVLVSVAMWFIVYISPRIRKIENLWKHLMFLCFPICLLAMYGFLYYLLAYWTY
ncbi:MAG: hypothetical protein IJ870_02090 [Alphaproteobacteria bacterium]|nr:hypothetical protein [Alphaproteobacteria bacterium]